MAVVTPIRAPEAQPSRVHPKQFHKRDYVVLGGAVAASFALVWLAYTQLLPFTGAFGFILCWLAVFFAMYYIAAREVDGRVVARDRAMAALVTVVAIAVVIPLVLIVGYVVYKGVAFVRVAFFTTTSAGIGPENPASQTGGAQAIVGTLEQVGIATLISVPLGMMTAVYLNEVGGRLKRPVRIFVDTMSGVPSIVAGLFIFTVLVEKHGFSGFAAALALSILMLPTVTRTSEVVLRLVPDGLREASLALGSPHWRTVWGVVMPSARSGLVTAAILGVARVVGETAPLIMTAFGSETMNTNPFSGAQAALPLSAYQHFLSSQNSDVDRAWLYALVLLLIVLVLFVTARVVGRGSIGRR